MTFKIFSIALGVAGLLFSVPAATQVNRTQQNEQRRIENGVRSGTLSRQEARRLRLEQRQIRLTERRFRSRHNGRLTWREKRMLERRQAIASRHIYNKRHNSRYRR